MKLSKELVGASAALLVLAILEDGKSYGYAIIERVKSLSGGEIEWTDGMLYPVLHRLEAQGWVHASWGESETGRKRKYYSLTTAGKQALADHKSQWQLVHKTLTQAWRLGHA